MALYIGDELIAGDVEGQKINNPFSLLDYKYSEYEISNASWLLSNGQWNSGAFYQSVYDLLLQIYNGTVIKAGVSVKLSTEAYADTDFVLNTGDTTFRLPVKVLMAGSKRVAGNGMTLGLDDGTLKYGIVKSHTNGTRYVSGFTNLYGAATGTMGIDDSINSARGAGITTDPTKSGIETSADGLYLYFYVGDTVQDANIIAAASVLTDVANLKNASNFSNLGKETVASWAMPSNTYDDLTLGASGATYTAPANGWFSFSRRATSSASCGLFNQTKSIGCYYVIERSLDMRAFVPVEKGDVVMVEYWRGDSTNYFRFIYAKGSEWEKTNV